MTGIDLIAKERQEQFTKHGRTLEQDAEFNNKYQLLAGAYNLLKAGNFDRVKPLTECPDGWDSDIWIKMWAKSYKERLIIAGALIAAEIDRLQN